MVSVVHEYAVERSTTEKLATLLNDIAAAGRQVQHTQFLGGRDWAVISHRTVDLISKPFPEAMFSDVLTDFAALPPTSGDFQGCAETALGLTVGSYDDAHCTDTDGAVTPLNHRWSGWVEDRDRSWILFLDGHGRPELFYPRRDSDGGVIGAGIALQRNTGKGLEHGTT